MSDEIKQRLNAMDAVYPGFLNLIDYKYSPNNAISALTAIDACIQGTEADKAQVLVACIMLISGISEDEKDDYESFSDDMLFLCDAYFADDKEELEQNALYQQTELVWATERKIKAASALKQRLDAFEDAHPGFLGLAGEDSESFIPVLQAIDACIPGSDKDKASVIVAYILRTAGISESPAERCEFEDFSMEMCDLSDLHFAEDQEGLEKNKLYQQVQLVLATERQMRAASAPKAKKSGPSC